MRDLRRQNKIEPQNKELMPIESSEFDLINQIKQLKKENDLLKITNYKLSKNEDKLLSAIKSEVINQSTPYPIISRTKFLTKLGMNSKYLDDSIKGLVDKKIIERTPVKYSASIMTNSWKIL